MNVHVLKQEQRLPLSPEAAWEFFSAPRNLDELTPPEMVFKIIPKELDPMHEGQIIWYRIRIAPLIWRTWVTEITHVREGKHFVDEQRIGPYALWHHRHEFKPLEGGGVLMTDTVHYALPFGPLGDVAHALFVKRQLEGIFTYRREKMEAKFGRG